MRNICFTSQRGMSVISVFVFLLITERGFAQPLNETQKIVVPSCICKSCAESIIDIECTNKVSLREIHSILNRPVLSGEMFEFHLRISSRAVVNIPANVVNGRRFSRIFVHCAMNDSSVSKLKIDPNAFRTSSHRTDTFRIFNCDLSHQNDFAFLSDFEQLTSLSIQSSQNLESFAKLPLLPNLRTLTIFNCTGLEKLEKFPVRSLPVGLKELDLALNLLNDESIERILSSIPSSPSAKTLEILRLSGNRLTRIPDSKTLSSLTSLSQLFLDGNIVPKVTKESLDFSSQMPNLEVLNLMDMSLAYIEPYSLDHVKAKVHLDMNNLTSFDSSVYKRMLEHSNQTNTGGLTFTSNLLNCDDCGLAWLIRDNSHLINSVEGTCYSNSTISVTFQDLDANDFKECPSTEENKTSAWLYFLLMKLVGVGL